MDYTIIITTAVSAFTAIAGFFAGKRRSDAEATQTAFNAYNVALESLRAEMEANGKRWNEIRKAMESKIESQGKRIDELEKEREENKKRILDLEKENIYLKEQISKIK